MLHTVLTATACAMTGAGGIAAAGIPMRRAASCRPGTVLRSGPVFDKATQSTCDSSEIRPLLDLLESETGAIASGPETNFSHSTPVTIATPSRLDRRVYVSNPNRSVDALNLPRLAGNADGFYLKTAPAAAAAKVTPSASSSHDVEYAAIPSPKYSVKTSTRSRTFSYSNSRCCEVRSSANVNALDPLLLPSPSFSPRFLSRLYPYPSSSAALEWVIVLCDDDDSRAVALLEARSRLSATSSFPFS